MHRRNFLELLSATGGIFVLPSNLLAFSGPKLTSFSVHIELILEQTFTQGLVAMPEVCEPIITVSMSYDYDTTKIYESTKVAHFLNADLKINNPIYQFDNVKVAFDGKDFVYQIDNEYNKYTCIIYNLKEAKPNVGSK